MNRGKATYRMHVKHLCREELRRFISDRLVPSKLLNARVFCLLGREALEIAEVYDALGIKRENITCLERDNAVYNELRRRYLGINLKRQTFSQFASRPSIKPYDIVALDFTGQIATFEREISQFIKNGHLADEAIVFTNFIGAREAAASKGYYYYWGTQEDVRRIALEELHRFGNRRSISPEQSVARLSKRLQPYAGNKRSDPTLWQKNLAALRGEAIHRALTHSLTQSRSGRLINLFFHERDHEGYLTREVQLFRNGRMPSDLTPFNSESKDILHAIHQFNKKRDDAFPALLLYDLAKRLRKHLEALLRSSLRRKGFCRGDYVALAQIWLTAIDCVLGREAVSLDSKSLKYIGDGGSPMFADVFHIRRVVDFDFLRKYLRLDAKTVRSLIAPILGLPTARFLALSREISRKVRIFHSLADVAPKERIFLGSEKRHRGEAASAAPKDTRQHALDLLVASPTSTIEDVALAVKAKPMQVAAWKAHVTMGTYEISDQADEGASSKLTRLYRSKSVTACSHLPPAQIEVLASRAYTNGDFAFSLALNRLLLKAQPENIRTMNNLAVLLSSSSRTRAAAQILDKALAIKPNDRWLLFNKAAVLKETGKSAEAIFVLRTVVDLYPNDKDACIALGGILTQEQQHSEALNTYDSALLRWPKDRVLLAGKARSLSELKQSEEALLWFNRAIRNNPNTADDVYNRGVTLADLGRIDQAIRDFRRAAKKDPMHVNALYNLGTLLLQKGRVNQALVTLRRAIAADPGNSAILNNLGVALFRTKRYREGLSCYSAVLDMRPNDAAAYFNQAAAFEQLGDLHNAVYFAKEAVRRRDVPSSYHFHLGRFLKQLNYNQEALSAFEKSMSLDPTCVPAFVAASSVSFELREFERGCAYLYKALEMEPSNPTGLALHATVLMNLERCDEAYGICEALLERSPKDVDFLMLKIDLLLRMDRKDEAARYADLLYKREKRDCNVLFNLGTIFGNLGRFKASIGCFKRSLQRNPEDTQALTNLGIMLLRDGQVTEAMQSFVAALELDPDEPMAASGLTKIAQILERAEQIRPA